MGNFKKYNSEVMSETDDCEEDVVQDEGDVDQGHDDPLVSGAPVSGGGGGGQGYQVPEGAQQHHARRGSWADRLTDNFCPVNKTIYFAKWHNR